MNKKAAVVFGAGGFIGHHLVKRLKKEGYWVRGVDVKAPLYEKSEANEFVTQDLTSYDVVDRALNKQLYYSSQFDKFYEPVDEVYQLAADMGGAGYIFTGDNDSNIMSNSAQINLNTAKAASHRKVKKVFYSSSACVYPAYNQTDPNNPKCTEESAYPAAPDSEYGWEKLFSERLYLAYCRNKDLEVRIARFHNIFGPLGTWKGGKEKAPAAICRKVLESTGEIEIWGDGNQTRSFLYVDECVEGIRKLTDSNVCIPLNIGSDEMVTINQLVDLACSFENKQLTKKYKLDAPTGVRGRNSDNALIKELINWAPSAKLVDGLRDTYFWIKSQIELEKQNK